MDYNFSDMVNEGLKRGLSFEEIATDFTKTLNEIQKKDQEKDARGEYIDKLTDNIGDWADGNVDASLTLAADMATLAAYDTHDGWTADRLRQFDHDAKEQLDALISLYEMEDQGDPFARVLRKGLDIGSNKSKEEEKKTAAPVGKAEDKDTEQLLRFLRQLGL